VQEEFELIHIARDPEPTCAAAPVRQATDDRLPRPGTVLARRYKGQMLQVRILASGFAFAGQAYASLPLREAVPLQGEPTVSVGPVKPGPPAAT
jgi:Protein of unknown function (DUF2924)